MLHSIGNDKIVQTDRSENRQIGPNSEHDGIGKDSNSGKSNGRASDHNNIEIIGVSGPMIFDNQGNYFNV